MTLNLDKSDWKHVTLREVIRHVTDRVDPETSGLERFLAGEHIPSNSLEIHEWGLIGQDPVGPMFYKRFQPGHVLYVSRRAYLRKTAVPRFTGICGEKTFVLETSDQSILLQEFLPFVLSADRFHKYAIMMSRGSVNPYINWRELAAYEFDLPPIAVQKCIADLLWGIERHEVQLHAAAGKARTAASALVTELRQRTGRSIRLREVATVRNGQTFPKSLQGSTEGDVPFFKVSDLDSSGNERWLTCSANWINESDVSALGAKLMAPGTIVMARVGAAIKMERRRILAHSSLVDDNHLAITPLSIDGVFLWAVLNETALSVNRNDGVVPSLNQAIVGAAPIPDCGDREAERIGSSYLAAHETSDKLVAEATATCTLRAAVLSSVFAGSE
jgi:type I restriction enzyme S subunit